MTKVGLVRRGHGRRGRSRPQRWDPPIKWFGVGYELSHLNSLFDSGMSIVGFWLQPSESSLQLVPYGLFYVMKVFYWNVPVAASSAAHKFRVECDRVDWQFLEWTLNDCDYFEN